MVVVSPLQYIDTRLDYLQSLSLCRYSFVPCDSPPASSVSHGNHCRRLDYCTTAPSSDPSQLPVRVYYTHRPPRTSSPKHGDVDFQAHSKWVVPTMESDHCNFSLRIPIHPLRQHAVRFSIREIWLCPSYAFADSIWFGLHDGPTPILDRLCDIFLGVAMSKHVQRKESRLSEALEPACTHTALQSKESQEHG